MYGFPRFLLALTLAASPLDAHDFWIEPSSFSSPAGAEIAVRLRVGESLVGESQPRWNARILDFYAHHGEQRWQISGPDGAEPAGLWRPGAAGLHTLVYSNRGSYVTLRARTFSKYLGEEGLDTVLAERRRLGEERAPARERFSRHAKALVAVGTAAGEDRALGLELELVAERNPYDLRPGAPLPVRLLYRGEPLANAQIVARAQARREHAALVRTDGEGRALLHLDAAGPWLVKAVHMVRAEADPRAEWHSLWASLTFALPGR